MPLFIFSYPRILPSSFLGYASASLIFSLPPAWCKTKVISVVSFVNPLRTCCISFPILRAEFLPLML